MLSFIHLCNGKRFATLPMNGRTNCFQSLECQMNVPTSRHICNNNKHTHTNTHSNTNTHTNIHIYTHTDKHTHTDTHTHRYTLTHRTHKYSRTRFTKNLNVPGAQKTELLFLVNGYKTVIFMPNKLKLDGHTVGSLPFAHKKM